MSDLQAQVDVGQLTVAGLGMFAPLLAAFTADDVAPMAMVQLERLGAAFPISGPQAMQVADCLQRFSSTKLERFGIIIGWRKGDTASFMAKSSSGQSIALLAFCLGEIFPNTFGTILYHLSAKLMPASSAVASPTQLGVAGGILKTKLACLGFGNTLAKHVARIYDAYKHLQVPMPTDLLEPFSAESAVELFHGISRAVRDENCIVRISGTTCLGYIVGAVMILFPDDAMVSVDDYVIHEGPRRSVLVELKAEDSHSPSRVAVEHLLGYSQTITLPIVPVGSSNMPALSSRWDGWISDKVRLEFLAKGFQCPEELLLACCTLLVLIPDMIKTEKRPERPSQHPVERPRGTVSDLLGSYSLHRMMQSCQTVFQMPPFEPQDSPKEAYTSLMNIFESAIPRSDLECCANGTDLSQSWARTSNASCAFHALWKVVGWALDTGLLCFFVTTGTKATVDSASDTESPASPRPVTNYLVLHSRDPLARSTLRCRELYGAIMKTIIPEQAATGRNSSPGVDESDILSVSGSSTLYPSLLRAPDLDVEGGVRFELVEGQLQHKGRSYAFLTNHRPVRRRPDATEPLYSHEATGIVPSSLGAHSSLVVSLEVGASERSVRLRLTARYSGQNVPIDMWETIIAAYKVTLGQPCQHPRDSPLDCVIPDRVITTSMAAPTSGPRDDRVSVVQVARNATAQFLACSGALAILQKHCCLNCAYKEAVGDSERRVRMVIAG